MREKLGFKRIRSALFDRSFTKKCRRSTRNLPFLLLQMPKGVDNMRQKMITLDAETWKLAEIKSNFSEWVRNSLRSERNKQHSDEDLAQKRIEQAGMIAENLQMSTAQLLWHLEQRSEVEINALVSILQGSLQ